MIYDQNENKIISDRNLRLKQLKEATTKRTFPIENGYKLSDILHKLKKIVTKIRFRIYDTTF